MAKKIKETVNKWGSEIPVRKLADDERVGLADYMAKMALNTREWRYRDEAATIDSLGKAIEGWLASQTDYVAFETLVMVADVEK